MELGLNGKRALVLASSRGLGFAKTLAREVAPHGINVNIIAPGRIATERLDELDRVVAAKQGKTPEEVRAARARRQWGRGPGPAEAGPYFATTDYTNATRSFADFARSAFRKYIMWPHS